MILSTRDFGKIEINEDDIITFKQPIYGFEYLTRFVFLYDQNMSNHFVWMQSVEEQNICFILVDPNVVTEGYDPIRHADIQQLLGKGDYMYWLTVVVAENFAESTANLKSPIIVNVEKKVAAQVISEQDLPIRFPLVAKGRGSE